MAEEFVQLYRDQALERKPAAAAAANELIARNITTPAVRQDAAKATEPSVKTASVNPFEHVAHALTTQTLEFFARPASHEPAKPVAVRSAQK
jgi:hypothetical protein